MIDGVTPAVTESEGQAGAFAPRLLEWFAVHGRKHLPWQENPTPYRVWISEVMLQQTQVTAVIPYFQRFVARFPDLAALASAPPDEVLHLWAGLGYYARARNLRACAQVLIRDHDGRFPAEIEALIALPGIGRSTGGAILALSLGLRHPILDGNVKRVLARVFGIAGDPGSSRVLAQLWRLAEQCTPGIAVAAYTQAIMDLGATVCTRARPACLACPLPDLCVAARTGRQHEFPGLKPQRIRPSRQAVLLLAEAPVDAGRAILVERRPSPGIWGGLWSPPQFADEDAALAWAEQTLRVLARCDPLPAIEHAFTHFNLRLQPLRVACRPQARVAMDAQRLWYRLDAPPRVGLPQPIRRLFARLVTT
jgi:A/G-specific adenine glycosylase